MNVRLQSVYLYVELLVSSHLTNAVADMLAGLHADTVKVVEHQLRLRG